jgi:DNA ligase-1
MLNRRQFASLISLAVLGTTGPARGADAPALMLANVYRPGATPLADYWVSEKYDGVRGYWDGQRLLTRGGEAIAAPAWFTDGWPAVPMDGELWAGRGRFSQAASTVRQQKPMDDAWRALRFMVFDLPAQGGPFDERIPAYQQLVASLGQPWVQAVVQRKVASDAELQALLRRTVNAGGEGLMLHRGTSLYRAARTDDLMKLKPWEDAEAKVIAHLPGQGKHAGRLGALMVETPQGLRLKLGTGFYRHRTRAPATGRRLDHFPLPRHDEPGHPALCQLPAGTRRLGRKGSHLRLIPKQ